MPILTAEQAREEFKSVLNVVAAAAMFQYTFVVAVHLILASADPTAPEFGGFVFSRRAWGFIAPLGASALNLYVGRNLGYLTTLVRMHPRQRRALRFLARHHPWFLNPYRVLCRPRSMHPLGGAMLYVGVVVSSQIPAALLYEDMRLRSPAPTPLSGYAWIPNWLVAWMVGLLLVTSYFYLGHRVSSLGNALWRGRYAPEPTRPRPQGARTPLMDLFPNRGIAVKRPRSTERNPTSHSGS